MVTDIDVNLNLLTLTALTHLNPQSSNLIFDHRHGPISFLHGVNIHFEIVLKVTFANKFEYMIKIYDLNTVLFIG